MTAIDREWIKERIGGRRGVQAELAHFIGISPQKMSLVMSGARRLTVAEAAKVQEFFGTVAEGSLSANQRSMIEIMSRLTEEEQQLLLRSAKAQLDERDTPPE